MNQEDIICIAREVGIDPESDTLCNYDGWVDTLVDFAALVAAAERKAMMQLFTDPENQPTQHGTVTVEYMQREIAAEREACAKVCDETLAQHYMKQTIPARDEALFLAACADCAAAIRARGQA